MKYTFETRKNGDEYHIKFIVGENGNAFSNSVQHEISISGENPQWPVECPQILQGLMDNLRFSVVERKNAEQDLNMFLGFLYGNLLASINNQNKAGEPARDPEKEAQMIVENGDPAVVAPEE